MNKESEGRVLLTGATGFIGSRLLRRLGQKNIRTRALCRQSGSQASKTEWMSLDLSAPDTSYSQAVRDCKTVVHLAGQAHDPSAEKASYYSLNTSVTRHLAQAAAQADVRHFIFVSSIKVNGEDHASSQLSYSGLDKASPKDAYAESKWHAEQALAEICDRSGMCYTILRPPLVYGPGVKANFLALMQAVYQQRPLPFALIKNSRSLIYVDNLCDLILRLLEREVVESRTYTVADVALSTPELIRALAAALEVEPRLFSVPITLLKMAGLLTGKKRLMDRLTKSLVVDDSAIRRDLGWQPPVSLEQGMRETAEWFLQSGS